MRLCCNWERGVFELLRLLERPPWLLLLPLLRLLVDGTWIGLGDVALAEAIFVGGVCGDHLSDERRRSDRLFCFFDDSSSLLV